MHAATSAFQISSFIPQRTPAACGRILTAILSTLACWVTALPLTTTVHAEGVHVAYLMSYFVGDSVEENRLHLCWSSDGLHWTALNNDNPVVISSMSTKAIRDPAILRKQDGTYVLMYTDAAWSVGQMPTCGFWDSPDLVNWSNQRIRTLSGNPAVPAWGPEAIFDPASGKYIVLWSTASSDSIWYNTTTDFNSFSTEAPFFSPGYQVLENNIYKSGAYYYLFFKDERGDNSATTPYKAIKAARSSSLTPGSFTILTDDYITPHLSEGPVICKALNADRWYLYFDMFTQGGIFKCSTTTDINSNTAGWSALPDNQFALPQRVRNGHIFEIDGNELKTLRNVWDNGPNFAQGCAASASSQMGGNPASNANDLNYNTFWSAAAGNGANEWLEINLGTSRTFNKTVIRQTNSDRITGYKIQYHNGTAWADAYTAGTMGTNVKIDTFPPVTSSRVRLLVTAVQPGAAITAPEPVYSDILPTSETSGQAWKFTTAAPAANWNTSGFSDTGWNTGSGAFGVAEAQRTKVRTTWNTPDIWLRKTFNPGPLSTADLGNLKLKVDHDEDVEIYINGVLAASATGYTPFTYAYLDLSAAAKSALLPNSDNLIAVHCHQTGGGQIIDAGMVKQLPNGSGGTDTCPQISEFDVYQKASTTHTITAGGGAVQPAGAVAVFTGESRTFTFTPSPGHVLDQVLVDGVNNPAAVAAGTYTFSDVTTDHTISARFRLKVPATTNH